MTRCSLPRFVTTTVLLAALAVAQDPALRGLDPVALCKGKQEPGKPEFAVQRGGLRYQFASAASRATFEGEPERYEIQFGGACARMGPLSGAGDAQRWHVHKERIYVFASDQCREGFKKRPEAFLDADEPAPTDAAAIAAGKLLVERAAAAHGGVDRLRAWTTYRHQRSTPNGDTTELRRLQLQLPATARFDHDTLQGDKAWRHAQVVSDAASFFVDEGKVREMAASAAREARRQLVREPLLAMRLVFDGKAVATPAGKREVAGIAVEQCAVWCDGTTTTFGIAADGRVRTARFRGRGPGLWFGDVELVFDDFEEHGGLRLPATVRATFDGQDAPALHEHRVKIEVDGTLDPALFQAPK